PPFTAPVTLASAAAASVLRLALTCRGKAMTFRELAPSPLRFYLKGQAQHVDLLYELLFNHTLEVVLATGPDDPAPIVLDPECLRPVGFAADENVLPYTARSFPGYRLLTEYFAFRQKFLFCDLTGLDSRLLGRIGPHLEIYLFLNRAAPDLEQHLSADTFRLGCTPIINLYRQRAGPCELTQEEDAYRVVPDARHQLAHEVYAIERVSACGPDGTEVEYRPFFSLQHAADDDAEPAYWHAARRPAEEGGTLDRGTEVFLSLVDLRQS